MSVERIKLHGGRGDRFAEIREELEERLGYEPSNTEVVGRLMEEWPPDDLAGDDDADRRGTTRRG